MSAATSLSLSLWALPASDTALALGSWLVIFVFARFFFSWWLFRDYAVRSAATPLLFAASLTFSLSIFQMVLFEVTDVMRVGSRQWVWRMDLIAMTYLVVLVLPLSLFYAMARSTAWPDDKRPSRRVQCCWCTSTASGDSEECWNRTCRNNPWKVREMLRFSEKKELWKTRYEDCCHLGADTAVYLSLLALFSIRNFVSRVSLLGSCSWRCCRALVL